MMKKLITIITICYNAEKEVVRTLRSVVSQLTSEIEYIVIDGGSLDSSVSKIKEYSHKIDILISKKDKGVYDAYNKGIKLSNGKYLMFLNAGDFLSKNSISNIVKKIKNSESKIFYSKVNIYDENLNLSYVKKSQKRFFPFWLMQPYSTPSLVINKDIFIKYGNFDLMLSTIADYDFIIRLIMNNETFEEIDFITSNFVRGGVSDTKFDSDQRLIMFKKNNLSYFSYFLNNLLHKFFKIKNRFK